MRRLPTYDLECIPPSQILEWENENKRKIKVEDLLNYIPLVAWVFWMFFGTWFYAVHDGFGWPLGLYMSVNIGWALGFDIPFTGDHYGSQMSNLFSLIHTSIGVIFVGVAVIYIANVLTQTKDSWMVEILRKKEMERAAATDGVWDDIIATARLYGPKYKIFFLFFIWIIFGVVWGIVTVPGWGFLYSLDYTLSTLSGGGYVTLPADAPDWQYVVSALYATTGIPLMAISLGLLVTLCMDNPDDSAIFSKIVADVTQEEIDFMNIFGIDDGDGSVDNREFIILTVVRIGAAPPDLIVQINQRFQELDRKRQNKLLYDDLIYKRRRKAPTLRSVVRSNEFSKLIISKRLSEEHNPNSKRKRRRHYSIRREYEIVEASPSLTSKEVPVKKKRGFSPVPFENNNSLERDLYDMSLNCSADEPESQQSCGSYREGTNYQSPSRVNDIESGEVGVDLDESEVKDSDMESDRVSSTRRRVSRIDSEGSARSATMMLVANAAMGSMRRIKQEDDMEFNSKISAKMLNKLRSVDESSGHHIHLPPVLSALYLAIVDPYCKAFIAWVIWIVAGSVFYSIHDNVSFMMGFHTSVSVGYGIFWTEMHFNPALKAFTICYLLIGSTAIGGAMAAFARALSDTKSNWYVDALRKKQLAAAEDTEGYWDDIVAIAAIYWPKVKIHAIFFVLAACGTLWSCLTFDWTFIDGLYFALSAMSAGGLVELPDGSEDWKYVLVSLYICIGVPVMAIAFGLFAHQITSFGASDCLEEKLNARYTEEEVEMMKSFEIDGMFSMDI